MSEIIRESVVDSYTTADHGVSYSFQILPILLILFVGFIFLQIYLSKKDNKWLGLIIPIILFFVSIILCLSYINSMSSSKVYILSYFLTFLLFNIPTAIYLVIYAVCRENLKKMNKMSQLDKMNIQDLE